jgi:hypothetical protein
MLLFCECSFNFERYLFQPKINLTDKETNSFKKNSSFQIKSVILKQMYLKDHNVFKVYVFSEEYFKDQKVGFGNMPLSNYNSLFFKSKKRKDN